MQVSQCLCLVAAVSEQDDLEQSGVNVAAFQGKLVHDLLRYEVLPVSASSLKKPVYVAAPCRMERACGVPDKAARGWRHCRGLRAISCARARLTMCWRSALTHAWIHRVGTQPTLRSGAGRSTPAA